MTHNHTELVFIIDKSGSMAGLESDTLGGYNAMLHDQKQHEGECIITTVLFNHQIEILHDRLNLNAIKPLTDDAYHVGGSTALIDAIGWTIKKINTVQKQSIPEYQANKVMFVIITDGEENSSSVFTSDQVKQMIEHQTQTGWEFIFLGANIDAVETAHHFGIARNRAQDFNADEEGVRLNFKVMSNTLRAFRESSRIPDDWNEEIGKDYTNRK